MLVWDKRRWRCPDADCEVATWTEQAEAIVPRAVLTERARWEIFRRIGAEGRSTAAVARAFGIAWATAWAAFESLARPAVEDPARIGGVEALGIDETGFLAATPTHPRIFATGLVDVRRGLLCDVIQGRSAAELRRWLAARPIEWLTDVEVVSIDPHEAYRLGLWPDLAHVIVVADPFHIVRLANRALDDVRRRTQQELTGHRGRRGDPLYDIRKVLLTGAERLTDITRARLDAALAAGDPRDKVVATWLAKEHLREVYAVDDAAQATVLLDAVIAECATSEVKELRRLGATLTRWRTEILAHHRTGDSKRTDRGHEPAHQEHQAGWLRVHQLRELSAASARPLWSQMADSPNRIDARPLPPLGRVAPDLRGGGIADARAWRTVRRCTLNFRASARTDRSWRSRVLRISSNNSTFDLVVMDNTVEPPTPPVVDPRPHEVPLGWGQFR